MPIVSVADFLSCSSSPCKNGGTCVNQAFSNAYKCKCPQPYHGTNCEQCKCRIQHLQYVIANHVIFRASSHSQRGRKVTSFQSYAPKKKKNLFATNNNAIKQEKQRNNTEVSSQQAARKAKKPSVLAANIVNTITLIQKNKINSK